jgi:hypothetical protein
MGQCPQQLFDNITPEQFAALCEKAQASGIPISGDSGVAEKMGIEVTWNYNPESRVLTIQCTHVPFFVSCNDVNMRINALIQQTLSESAG